MTSKTKLQSMLSKESVCTLPNAISFLRLLLIPLFMHLYRKDLYFWALGVIVLSALSDMVDGKIARRFNMVSDFGKAFDPVVDKLTQAAMLYCLLKRFPHMLYLFVFLAVKEISTGITSLIAIHKSDRVLPADWHGKAATAAIYATVMLHLLWPYMDAHISDLLLLACAAMMAIAFVHYLARNIRDIRHESGVEKE